MKKLLLLGTLLAGISGQAQETAGTTYYWPDQRVTKLASDTQYFIYNTARSSDSYPYRSFFIFSNGSILKSNNVMPTNFLTTENKYIFTLEKTASSPENQWNIKSIDGYVDIAGNTTNQTAQDIYITSWANAGELENAKASVTSANTSGEYVDPSTIASEIWMITKGTTPEDNNEFAWNGAGLNSNTLGEGSQWTRWAKAHPYAFYTVGSITITEEINALYEEAVNKANPYALQQAIGLVQSEQQLSSNAPETTEGPLKYLIDGNANTFFHSAWTYDPTTETSTPHNIQVALNEPINSFYFYTKKRNDSNRPSTIKIYTSLDGREFQELKTISSGLTAKEDYISEKISSENQFQYIRFDVTATNTNSRFFNFSEFYLFDGEKYDDINTSIETLNSPTFLKGKTEEDVQTFCSDFIKKIDYLTAKNKLSAVEHMAWGTEVHQYTKPNNYDNVVNTATNLSDNSTEEEIKQSITDLNSLIENRTINQPKAGKFYRLKSALLPSYYISSKNVSENNVALITSNPQEAIFFLTDDMRLITPTLSSMDNYKVVADLGKSTTFKESKIKCNSYCIRNNGGSYFFANPNKPLDRHGSEDAGLTTPGCAWTLEEVTATDQQPTLSKEIGNAGYATLGAPVALNIPEGVKAYTVTVNENNTVATLNEVTGGIIPAACGVVLEKTGGDGLYNFTFAAGADDIEENRLVPLYKETTIDGDINAYILANKTNGIGFYQLDPNDRTIGANKAYLELPSTLNHVRSITIGGPTTGIEETVANGNEAEEYYDLQGRRVLNPTKGIYVTKSGKKVIINK